MKRIDTSTRAIDLFGLGKDGFKDGDLANGIAPTDFNAAWPNGMQEEVLAVVEAAGLVPSGSDLSQLLKAIKLVTPGRLLRTLVYTRVAGVQNVSINGAANTPAGAGTYTAPAGLRFVIAQVQGGGNAGAGATTPAGGQISMGSPGGCGAYGSGNYPVAAIGASQTITVGVGGAGVAGGNGGAGGASSFGTLLSAPGGIGSLALNSFPAANLANGNGSLTASPTGANLESTIGFSAGQSLVINAGTAAGILPASGQASRFGPGGQGALNAVGGVVVPTHYGAGGSAVAALSGSAGPYAGGAGAAGAVFLYEFG